MKQLLFAALLVAALAGCRSGAQVPPNPTTYSCPATTGTAYTAIGPASLNLTPTHTPGAGTWCYIAQAVSSASTPQLVSVPSAPSQPYTATAGQAVPIAITPATGGITPTGYIVSFAPASSVTILAPAVR